jgi:hypothetical protein
LLKKNRRLRMFIFPVVCILVLISLLIYHNLNEETALPSQSWSRSIDLEVTTGNQNPFIRKDAENYHIYTSVEGEISHQVVDPELNVIDQNRLPLDGTSDIRDLWAKESVLLYFQDERLQFFDGTDTSTLVDEIDGMAAAEDIVTYWRGNEIFSVDPSSFSSKKIVQAEHDIETVKVSKGSSSLLVVTNSDENKLTATFYQENNAGYKSFPIFTKSSFGNKVLGGFNFVEHENELTIVYSSISLAQGNRTYTNYLTTIDVTQEYTEIPFEKVTIYDEKTNAELQYEEEMQLLLDDEGELSLWLIAKGEITPKHEAVNIYEASETDGRWLAARRSNTYNFSHPPYGLYDEALFWKDLFASGQYSLMAAGTDPNLIEESQQAQEADWERALSDSSVALASSLITLLFSLGWVVPTLIYLFIFSEKTDTWVKVVAYSIYVGMQLLIFPLLMTSSFEAYAPSLLTFTGSSFVLPILLAALVWSFTRYARSNDWGILIEVSFFMTVNSLITMFLIGPYVF